MISNATTEKLKTPGEDQDMDTGAPLNKQLLYHF